MQVFKTYFHILKTQLTSILIYGGIFLGLTILLTNSYNKEEEQNFKTKKVPAVVVNEDSDNAFLDGFIKYLEDYVVYADIEDNEEARKDALFYRKVQYILTIPEGFTNDFLAGKEVSMTKQIIPDSVEAVSVDNAVNNYLNMAKVYTKYVSDVNYDTLNNYIKENLSKQTKVSFDTKKNEGNNNTSFNNYYFNYLGYIMIAVFIIGVSTVMLSFQNLDIRRRHHASPITVRSMNLQLLLGNLVFILCYLVIFIAAGYFLNPIKKLNANLLLYWLNALVFAITALSLSYLVGLTVKSKKAVAAISTAISLSLAFISGMFVPQEFLGKTVLRVASFTPTYWFIKANNIIQSLTKFGWDQVSDVFGMMAIQLGFAAAIISIALVVSKRKSQQAA